MKDTERTLLAWAAQEIREMDELCRSSIDGYEPLDSSEMGRLKQLEALASGEKRDPCEEVRKTCAWAGAEVDRAYHLIRDDLELRSALSVLAEVVDTLNGEA